MVGSQHSCHQSFSCGIPRAVGTNAASVGATDVLATVLPPFQLSDQGPAASTQPIASDYSPRSQQPPLSHHCSAAATTEQQQLPPLSSSYHQSAAATTTQQPPLNRYHHSAATTQQPLSSRHLPRILQFHITTLSSAIYWAERANLGCRPSHQRSASTITQKGKLEDRLEGFDYRNAAWRCLLVSRQHCTRARIPPPAAGTQKLGDVPAGLH